MALSNTDYYKDATFQSKIKYLMQKAAIAVMAEAANTVEHTKRVAYASEILDGHASVQEFSLGVTTNSTIKTAIDASADFNNDLEFVVNSLFNAFAGVYLSA